MKIPLASEEGKGKKTRFGDIQSQNPGKPALSIEKPERRHYALRSDVYKRQGQRVVTDFAHDEVTIAGGGRLAVEEMCIRDSCCFRAT